MKYTLVQQPDPLKRPVEVTIGQYHDFIATNHKEIVLNPTPEDIQRIIDEGAIESL